MAANELVFFVCVKGHQGGEQGLVKWAWSLQVLSNNTTCVESESRPTQSTRGSKGMIESYVSLINIDKLNKTSTEEHTFGGRI